MPAATAKRSCIAGRFVLELLAGAGGMGTAYRARDENTGRTVAVKLLQPTGRDHRQAR
jgi:serine/threonine protein kinase